MVRTDKIACEVLLITDFILFIQAFGSLTYLPILAALTCLFYFSSFICWAYSFDEEQNANSIKENDN